MIVEHNESKRKALLITAVPIQPMCKKTSSQPKIPVIKKQSAIKYFVFLYLGK